MSVRDVNSIVGELSRVVKIIRESIRCILVASAALHDGSVDEVAESQRERIVSNYWPLEKLPAPLELRFVPKLLMIRPRNRLPSRGDSTSEDRDDRDDREDRASGSRSSCDQASRARRAMMGSRLSGTRHKRRRNLHGFRNSLDAVTRTSFPAGRGDS